MYECFAVSQPLELDLQTGISSEYWEMHVGALQEHQVLLTAEQSLHISSLYHFFLCFSHTDCPFLS